MQLNPRYGDDPILTVEGLDIDPVQVMIDQRARFGAMLASLDDAQWAAPSRCAGWSVQDVVTHLISTNQFWAFSIGAGRAGSPSRFLTNFDPVSSPVELVAAAGSPAPADTLAAFDESNRALVAAVADLDAETVWTTLAEAPPGHISIGALCMHAVWDAVIHERDIALPLGLAVPQEPDEWAVALVYVAILTLGFQAMLGTDRTGAIALRTTNPTVEFAVELDGSVTAHPGDSSDAFVLTGETLDVLEALSCRAALDADLSEADLWLFAGLRAVFDQPELTA